MFTRNYERDWEEAYYEAERQHQQEIEQLRYAHWQEIRDMRGSIDELLWEVERWEELARGVADAYRKSNGVMTEELRQAIERLIARIPVWDEGDGGV